MDYEKMYKEALERARKWANGDYGYNVCDKPKDIAGYVFPELKESEDAKIKKIIKASLQSYFNGKLSEGTNDVDYATCLTWLEKQKPAEWSEEDEKMVSGLLSIVEDWYNSQSQEEKAYYGDCGYINWLKSLRPQLQ